MNGPSVPGNFVSFVYIVFVFIEKKRTRFKIQDLYCHVYIEFFIFYSSQERWGGSQCKT